MKKIISIFFMGILIFLVGCDMNKENDISSILQSAEIKKFSVQFKTNTVDITDTDKLQSLKQMFSNCSLDTNSELNDTKGWIYAITASDNNNNELYEVVVLNKTKIKYKDKVYTCNNLNLSALDELSGFDREY